MEAAREPGSTKKKQKKNRNGLIEPSQFRNWRHRHVAMSFFFYFTSCGYPGLSSRVRRYPRECRSERKNEFENSVNGWRRRGRVRETGRSVGRSMANQSNVTGKD